MLTLETELKVLALQRTLGLSLGGACFGVSDPARLRPPTFVPMRRPAILQLKKTPAVKIGGSKRSPKKASGVAKMSTKK
jgi:hypothetical protein